MILSKYLPVPIPPTSLGLKSCLAAWAGGPEEGQQTGVRVRQGRGQEPQLWKRGEAALSGWGWEDWC